MDLDTVKQAAVTYLVNLVLEKVISYLSNFLGDQKEWEKIKVSLTEIRGFIEIAEGSPVLDPKLMELLEKIKDAAYDAEDLLEEYDIEDRRRSLIPEVFNRPKLASELKDVSERLEAIKAESDKFQLKETVANWESKFKEQRETRSFVIKSEVLGRETEKTKLLRLLLSPPEDVLVIPIVGMGGIGKTTLAQFAYNHEDVDHHFKLKMWIYVSDDFDFKKLQNKIIDRATGDHPGGSGPRNVERFERAAAGPSRVQIVDLEELQLQPSNVKKFDLEELQHRLRKALSGKRFLLVLDDVWNEELDKWERLRDLLICGGRGSRIVVTTRIRKVASIMSTISPIVLEGLPDYHCWSLFSQRALRNQREEEATHQVDLVSIGREIVKKCKGNPLAVLTLGGLLCCDTCETEAARWAKVRDSEIWNIANKNEYGILPALRLSYNHLQSHVKQCFAFCAIFPKNYEIEKEKLIKLWMANGFIPSKRGMEFEDIGNEIFNELVMKSFFQNVKEDFTESYGHGGRLFADKITLFSMHDLFHDLAQSVMGNECCVAEEGKLVKISKRVRHVSCFHLTSSEMLRGSLFEARRLRTFINYGDGLHLPSHAGKFSFSRVLDLNTIIEPDPSIMERGSDAFTELLPKFRLPSPPLLDNLKHIRYLDLSKSGIDKLPESLTSLYYLQTLILTMCKKLFMLPTRLRYLSNLRHLDIRGCCMLTQMPPGMGQLTCLQELTRFIVRKKFDCIGSGIGELQSLSLRGSLVIEHLESINDPIDVEKANLIGKPNLTSLELNWTHICLAYAESIRTIEEQILQRLQPHGNLEVLMLSNYWGIQFPSWMMDTTLATLQKIKLLRCVRLKHLPPLGQLPSLKVLEIIGLQDVEYIGDEIYGNEVSAGFPSLEELTIRDMGKLRRWSGWKSGRIFPRLVNLKIYDCPKLTTVILILSGAEPLCQGMLQNLTHLKIANCTQLKDVHMGLQNLTTLKSMSLKKCDLLFFPVEEMDGLISLQELSIDSCDRLNSFGEQLHHISHLKSLKIEDCKSTTLPNGISFLTSLRVLKLIRCDLESLPDWLGNLTSLHHLSIKSCYKITSLPKELQRLTTLEALFIFDCPVLARRCEKDIGKDYHKIQLIPHISIHPS